jgi:flagellar assembly factor FliW
MHDKPDLTPYLGHESPPIEFPSGLIGFEEWNRFVLLSHPAGGALRLLLSLEDERISFILIDPHDLLNDYRISISNLDAQTIQYRGKHTLCPEWPAELGVYCILSVQETPFAATVNLLGPLIINWRTGLGQQIIQSDSNYDPRYPIVEDSQENGRAHGKGGV